MNKCIWGDFPPDILVFALIGPTSHSKLYPTPLPGLSNHTAQWTDWILIPLWDSNQQPQSQLALQLIISTGSTSPSWVDNVKHTHKKATLRAKSVPIILQEHTLGVCDVPVNTCARTGTHTHTRSHRATQLQHKSLIDLLAYLIARSPDR